MPDSFSTIRRAVVGTDGSDNARHALRWVAGLARASDAEVVAVHCLGLLFHPGAGVLGPGALGPGALEPSQSHRDEIRALLDGDWTAPLRDAGVRHRAELRDGSPVTVLLAVADEFDADLLVVGRRGAGGFPGLLLGSTSSQLAQYSIRPVTIVPPASDET
jgi:nucleotide-binding universal stress UspA family protein